VKKIALVFLLAVFVPSLVLAWLAVLSSRDQQLVLERQESLLCQGVADALAKDADAFLAQQQQDFDHEVEKLRAGPNPARLTTAFDDRLRAVWPQAEVGFVVTEGCILTCPSPNGSTVAREFCADNGKFLSNVQTAEVYSGNLKTLNTSFNNGDNLTPENSNAQTLTKNGSFNQGKQNNWRNVIVQQQAQAPDTSMENNSQQLSKVAPAEAEFRQLVGDSTEGTVARFVDNKLKLLLWYRTPNDRNVIFGAQLSLPRIKAGLAPILDSLTPALREDVAVALLDENARPVAVSHKGFQANWKRPFVATELGEALPHWEMAVYLLNPGKLAAAARTLRFTLGFLVGVLLLAIGVGGWLIVADLNRQLALARQKTDFVSNVSHELKTPLTSIRMFSELLAEGRVRDPAKRQSYLNIITAETSRLTRLINNVLDFSRMERGEKKYSFQPSDLVALVRETFDSYRPHLEANGFQCQAELPEQVIAISADRDALAQVVVNLLSNAEKYSNARREITVQIKQAAEPLPHADVLVLDRGSGVPGGCEEKIFEQFYRAHDSLASGIQGSGLGLTLARQIARAHQGDVLYRAREGGGSCFIVRLPLANSSPQRSA
jgi:signal transduction histidine kinase